MAHNLPLPYGTLTPISVFLCLLVFEVGAVRDGQTDEQDP